MVSRKSRRHLESFQEAVRFILTEYGPVSSHGESISLDFEFQGGTWHIWIFGIFGYRASYTPQILPSVVRLDKEIIFEQTTFSQIGDFHVFWCKKCWNQTWDPSKKTRIEILRRMVVQTPPQHSYGPDWWKNCTKTLYRYYTLYPIP